MAKWLNTLGKTSIGIGECDRCHRKRAIADLVPDGNVPGMRVCPERCRDDFDPYRLPARQPDDLTLPFYRPILPDLTYDTAQTPVGVIATADSQKFIEPTSPYGPPESGMYGIEVLD